MHELSIAQSLLDMAREEMARNGGKRLTRIVVRLGAISGVVPESLQFCVELLLRGTAHEGAELVIVPVPLLLRCQSCGTRFGGEGQDALWMPCPTCGEQFGHAVEQGRELSLDRLEAE